MGSKGQAQVVRFNDKVLLFIEQSTGSVFCNLMLLSRRYSINTFCIELTIVGIIGKNEGP